MKDINILNQTDTEISISNKKNTPKKFWDNETGVIVTTSETTIVLAKLTSYGSSAPKNFACSWDCTSMNFSDNNSESILLDKKRPRGSLVH